MDDPGPRSPDRSRVWFFRIWSGIGAAVILGVLLWVLRAPLELLVPPLALAFVIVYLLNPVVNWQARQGVPRLVGVLAAYLAVATLLTGVVLLAGPLLVRQGAQLVEGVPDISAAVEDSVNDALARAGIDEQVTLDLSSADTQQAIEGFLEENRDQVASLIRGAGTLLTRVLHGLLTLILAPMLAFYLLVDLPRLSEGVRRLVPPDGRREVVEVTQRIGRTVGSYFRGLLLVAAFVGFATAGGLALIGLPFWAVVGIATGLFNLIPFIGPFVGGAIGVIIALTVGEGIGQAIAVVVVMTVVQQVDNHLITPNVVARTVKVHPVTVIIGLTVAGTLFGILGMFVAIPVLAAAKLILMYLLVSRVPAMAHLAGDGALFEDDEQDREGTLVGLGKELRRAFEDSAPR